jgi:ArsR family transcriptional regulator, lead/cadmium/zinc/bismuth-responsive transcriptional repressor
MKKSEEADDTCDVSVTHADVLNDVRSKMIEAQHIINMAELFKILGDTTRVSILAALSVSELCVCDIAALVSMSNSAISHQLRILKQTHIVRSRREGKTVYYRMADGHITQLLNTALEHSCEE